MINVVKEGEGWIEVICGSMFSGKTEELIRRLRRTQIAQLRVLCFKPALDNRYSTDHIVSHNEQKIPSKSVDRAEEILDYAGDAHVIGVDEAQFFGLELLDVCNTLADRGQRVIVAGLDQDYRGEPFEPMPQLLAIAEYITKTLAICMVCGSPANRTQRLSEDTSRVVVGATRIYEARCRKCFVAPVERSRSEGD